MSCYILHLMSDPEGTRQFCFPESPDVSQDEVKGNIRTRGRLNYTVKWKEPNRPQRPNRPQFLEGRFGTCWAVLDRKSQNSSRWYQFGPSNFWIGYTKSYFGTSSQFGPSDSQIKIPIWPQQGLLGATAVFGWSNHSHVWHNPKYGPFSRVRN